MYFIDTVENAAGKSLLFFWQKNGYVLETLDAGLGDPEQLCIYHNMTVDGNIKGKFKLKACM